MKLLFLILCVLFLIMIGCKGSINEADLPDTGDNYPVATGNMWQYQKILETTFYPADSASYTVRDSSEAAVLVTGTTTFPGDILTYRFETYEQDGIYETSGQFFYQVKPEGLFSYAYANAGTLVQPKSQAKATFVLNGHCYNSLEQLKNEIEFPELKELLPADSVIIETDPLLVLKYPLKLNSRWTYRPAFSPFKIEKKVTAFEYLTRQKRSFNCYLVRWIYDMDNNGIEDDNIVIRDHISAEGMIERNIAITGIIFTGPDMEVQGTADLKTRYILTDIDIKD